MKDYIMNVWGFEKENVVVLMDDGNHTSPTRSNILKAYEDLASATKSGDAAFCHYSGEFFLLPCIHTQYNNSFYGHTSCSVLNTRYSWLLS